MTRRVSNSEFNTWQQCHNQYKYAYDWNITPVKTKQPLYVGNTGHAALEIFYNNILGGESRVTAEMHAMQFITNLFSKLDSNDVDSRKMLFILMQILPRYFEYYKDRDAEWEILEVEQTHDIPILDDFSYVMKLDMLVYNWRTDKTCLIDHKFSYDFWQPWQYTINMQIPKYIGALRFDGKKIDEAYINTLRYRIKKDGSTDLELFKFKPVEFTDGKVRKAISEQITVSREIVAFRETPDAIKDELATRNTQSCKMCGFKAICEAQLEGQDISVLLATSYKQNTTYGYNTTETDIWE